ncbi:MAG: ABC transporter permease [Pyrinomonadaceae bacterium]
MNRPNIRASLMFGFSRSDLRTLRSFLRMFLRDRFLGSRLGVLWAVGNPLLMMSIFTFVFGFVFKAKLPGAETSLAYVVWMISGYGPWLAINESIMSSTTAVVANTGLIKNLAFKTELLPITGAMLGLLPLLVSVVYLAALLLADGRSPSTAWAILPIVLVCQLLMISGVGLVLSAVNVFIRDVSFLLPNLLLIALFATPIFYPIDSFPEPFRLLSLLNPFYVLTEGYRQPVVHGNLPPPWMLAYLAVVSAGTFAAGLIFFRRLKPFFDTRL